MKSMLQGILLLLLLLALPMDFDVRAQLSNSDWESIWITRPPTQDPSDPNYWMVGKRKMTGMAYDKFRDLLYFVSPDYYDDGSIVTWTPRVHIWNAMTGQVDFSVNGGELNCPTSVITGGLSQGLYSVYRADVDDEGRIYVCNLVAPVFGICPPDANPMVDCVPGGKYWYLVNQGPFKVYRWDTPTSTPVCVYKTLNSTHTAVGSSGNPPNSEQLWTRWGDVLDVLGKRATIIKNGQPVVVDSARIFASGGRAVGIIEPNREINLFLQDERTSPPAPFRLASKLSSNNAGFASHGIAVTGTWVNAEIYSEGNMYNVVRNTQGWSGLPQTSWPEYHAIAGAIALSGDLNTGTGESGPLAFFTLPGDARKFLICADAYPSNNNNYPNTHTCARVMDVTNPQGAFRVAEFQSNTPELGHSPFDIITGISEYITDVDYKIDIDQTSGHPHLIVFLMMTGQYSGDENGVAAFRSINPITVPIELASFRAMLGTKSVNLTWNVTSETNNHGFDIQRSFDNGSTWEAIAFVPGRGTTNEPYAYNYSDPLTEVHRSVGDIRYRLRQIDNDGRTALSPEARVLYTGGPATIDLAQNFPNPFNPKTTISYQLGTAGFVTLKVFNSIGDEVATLVNGTMDAGVHMVDFNADNLPSGTYVYQINVEGRMMQKKMVLMK